MLKSGFKDKVNSYKFQFYQMHAQQRSSLFLVPDIREFTQSHNCLH